MNLNLLKAYKKKTPWGRGKERNQQIKRVVEALLFTSSKPLSWQKLKEIINSEILVQMGELREIVKELGESYKKEMRAFQIDEIAEGLLLRTCKEMQPYVLQLQGQKKRDKIGPAAMEVLAIVAYRGPITKSEIAQIRGVDCAGPMQTLLERELITVVGHKESPGRPRQFGTTKKFLTHFGLKDKSQLSAAAGG